jgi:hypothetical protein
MSTWNLAISQAPRGRNVTQIRTIKGADVEVAVFERENVILATKCGKVTTSYYIPKEDRWCMLAAGEQPVAWMAWPEHPSHGREGAE